VGFVCFFQKIVQKVEEFQPLIFRPSFAPLLVLLVLLLNPFVDFLSGQSPLFIVCHQYPSRGGFCVSITWWMIKEKTQAEAWVDQFVKLELMD
jgi:hypothetical protein